MLTIVFKDGHSTEWHVGESTKILNLDEVKEITADLDELDYILYHIVNIPSRQGSGVITWHGDIARFILANM